MFPIEPDMIGLQKGSEDQWVCRLEHGVPWSKTPWGDFRSGDSTSKELVRDKNMRCHFWMDGKKWMAQIMINEWYHHVTSWSCIRSSSNLHSTAPFLLKMAFYPEIFDIPSRKLTSFLISWNNKWSPNLYLLEKTGAWPPMLWVEAWEQMFFFSGVFGKNVGSFSS